MTFLAPAQVITKLMVDQWALSSDYSAVPVEYDNDHLTPPNPDPENTVATSWVRQSISGSEPVGLVFSGAEQDHSIGFAIYQIFTPGDSSLGDAAGMAEEIRGFFNRQKVSGVTFIGVDGAGPSIVFVGLDDESGFFQTDVIVPFQYFD